MHDCVHLLPFQAFSSPSALHSSSFCLTNPAHYNTQRWRCSSSIGPCTCCCHSNWILTSVFRCRCIEGASLPRLTDAHCCSMTVWCLMCIPKSALLLWLAEISRSQGPKLHCAVVLFCKRCLICADFSPDSDHFYTGGSVIMDYGLAFLLNTS